MVKELRDKTGAGMSECKKALEETGGDLEGAVKVLRERGILKAAKRADRTASEGLVGFSVSGDLSSGALVEVNCETDFVSRSPQFQEAVASFAVAARAAKASTVESVSALALPSGKTVQAVMEDMQTSIGEKLEIGRCAWMAGDVVATYIHPPGKIGVLIAATTNGTQDQKAKVSEVIRDVAMHIAAFAPRFLDASQVDAATLESEKEIAANLARNEGKPENIIPRIVEGKIKAFVKDSCLLTQDFAKDSSITVEKYLSNSAEAIGATIKLNGFTRIAVGEGKAAPKSDE